MSKIRKKPKKIKLVKRPLKRKGRPAPRKAHKVARAIRQPQRRQITKVSDGLGVSGIPFFLPTAEAKAPYVLKKIAFSAAALAREQSRGMGPTMQKKFKKQGFLHVVKPEEQGNLGVMEFSFDTQVFGGAGQNIGVSRRIKGSQRKTHEGRRAATKWTRHPADGPPIEQLLEGKLAPRGSSRDWLETQWTPVIGKARESGRVEVKKKSLAGGIKTHGKIKGHKGVMTVEGLAKRDGSKVSARGTPMSESYSWYTPTAITEAGGPNRFIYKMSVEGDPSWAGRGKNYSSIKATTRAEGGYVLGRYRYKAGDLAKYQAGTDRNVMLEKLGISTHYGQSAPRRGASKHGVVFIRFPKGSTAAAQFPDGKYFGTNTAAMKALDKAEKEVAGTGGSNKFAKIQPGAYDPLDV